MFDPLIVAAALLCGLLSRAIGLPALIGYLGAGFVLHEFGITSGDMLVNLAELGVTSVVNTCDEYAGPVDAYQQHGIQQLRIPTVDFTHPLIEDVIKAVDFIEKQVADGSTVYIHCKAGRARSATVALCWLIRHQGLSPREAQKLLLDKRPHVNPRVFARPVVKQFCDHEAQRQQQAAGSSPTGH